MTTLLERAARYTVEFDDGTPDIDQGQVLYAILALVNDLSEEDQIKARESVLKTWGCGNLPSIDLWDVRTLVYSTIDNPGTWMTKAGKLPKRISKAFHTTLGVKVNTEKLAQLGEQLQRMVKKHGVHYIDTTQDFSWNSGDFDDAGSCFWGSRMGARDMILEMDGFAIRAFEDDTYVQGKARAWIVPVDREGIETYYLFNTYGARMEYFCNLIAKITGYEFTSVDLYNHGSTYNTLYINSNSGYCIHPRGMTVPDTYDFDCDDNYTTCYNCGDRVDDDDRHCDDNGYDYCSDCYYQLFARCEHCDCEMPRDDAIDVEETVTNYYGGTYTRTVTYCERCAAENGYAKCEHCEQWSKDCTGDDTFTVCMDCYENKGYAHCEDCECLVTFDSNADVPDAYNYGDHVYCVDCYNEHEHTCPECGAPSEDWEPCQDCKCAIVRRREGWNEPQLFSYDIRTVTYTGELFDHVVMEV